MYSYELRKGVEKIFFKLAKRNPKQLLIIENKIQGCYNYGLTAIKQYGFFKGWAKTIGRVLRCNPWNEGSNVDYPRVQKN
ncbi:membrane protein insertion efficiency factor YidD [Candidatus Woesearchaeota archaeon]|nr:membrane protein insertion efficiency factor YidD [Candidatus Woesearchaeota archaeon]